MAGGDGPHRRERLGRDIHSNDKPSRGRRQREASIASADIKNPTGFGQRLKKRPVNTAQAGRIDRFATRATPHSRMNFIVGFAKGPLRRLGEQARPPRLLDLSLIFQMISRHELRPLASQSWPAIAPRRPLPWTESLL